MSRRYAVEFRRKVPDLIEAGKAVAEIANQLGVTAPTAYNWRDQDLIDHGLCVGMSTSHSAELAAARSGSVSSRPTSSSRRRIEARRQRPWFSWEPRSFRRREMLSFQPSSTEGTGRHPNFEPVDLGLASY